MVGAPSSPARPRVPFVAAAPAAALVEWGVFVLGVFSIPMQPYHAATWDTGALASLVVLGALASAVGRGAAGLAGVIVGAGGAVTVLLYVLGRQATVNIGVLSSIIGPRWLGEVAGSLLIGLAVVCAGFLSGAAVRRMADHRGGARPGSRVDPRDVRLVLVALAATMVVTGASLVAIGGSAYVLSGGTPATTPGRDGGFIASACCVLGVVVAGWSAAGSAVAVRRRLRGGIPRPGELRVGLLIGIPVALLLVGWALLVISLAEHPF